MNYRQVTCCNNCKSVKHIGAFASIINGFSYEKPTIMCGACGVVTTYYDQKQERVKPSILKPSTWFKEQWRNV